MSRAEPAPGHRRLGAVACGVVAVVGVLYLGVIGSWVALVGTPAAPIGDPYLLAMELLTLVSASGIVGWVVAELLLATPRQRASALAAFASGTCAAALTLTVHLVQLTAIRQLWRAGDVADYRLVWPSGLFAVEYVAWDVFVGLTMLFLGITRRVGGETRGVVPLVAGGILCLAGFAGPLSGVMWLQNLAVAGYAVLLPLGAYRAVATFREGGAVDRVPLTPR